MSAQHAPAQGLSLTDPRCAEVLNALPGLSPQLHTPGPWRLYEGSEDVGGWMVHGPIEKGYAQTTVARVTMKRRPEHEANARLIAASPELLDLLREAASLMPRRTAKRADWVCRARAVLAKVNGSAA